MFCDPLPLQLLSKNNFFSIFWNGGYLPSSYLDNVFIYTGFFGRHPLVMFDILLWGTYVVDKSLLVAEPIPRSSCSVTWQQEENCADLSVSIKQAGARLCQTQLNCGEYSIKDD